MANYIVREEDGTSKLTLEDGSGSLLLEDGNQFSSVAAAYTFGSTTATSTTVVTAPFVFGSTIVGTVNHSRVTQLAVEVLCQDPIPHARVTQLAVEVLRPWLPFVPQIYRRY